MGDKANMAKRRPGPGYVAPVSQGPVPPGRSPTRKDETKDGKNPYSYKPPSNSSGDESDEFLEPMYYQQQVSNKHILQGHHPGNPGIMVDHGNAQRFPPNFPAGPGPGPGVQSPAGFSMSPSHHGHPSNISLGQVQSGHGLHSNLPRSTGVGLQSVGSNPVPGQPSSSIGRYPQTTHPSVPYPTPMHGINQIQQIRMPMTANNGMAGGANSGLTPNANNPRGAGGPNTMAPRGPTLMAQNPRTIAIQPPGMSRSPGGPVNQNPNPNSVSLNSSPSGPPSSSLSSATSSASSSSSAPNPTTSATVAPAAAANGPVVTSVNSSNNSNPNLQNNHNSNIVGGPSPGSIRSMPSSSPTSFQFSQSQSPYSSGSSLSSSSSSSSSLSSNYSTSELFTNNNIPTTSHNPNILSFNNISSQSSNSNNHHNKDVNNGNSDISNSTNPKGNVPIVRPPPYPSISKVVHNANVPYGSNLTMKILDKGSNTQDIPFDPSDFPALRSGLLNDGGSSNNSSSNAHKSSAQEFHILNEDFPALPGSKEITSPSLSMSSTPPVSSSPSPNPSSTPSSSTPSSGSSSLNSSQDHKDQILNFQYVTKQNNSLSLNNPSPSQSPSPSSSSSVQSSDSLPSSFGHYYATSSSHFPSPSSTPPPPSASSSKQQSQQPQGQTPGQHLSQHPHSHLSGLSSPSPTQGSSAVGPSSSTVGGGAGGQHGLVGGQHQHSNFANISQGNVSGYEYFNHLQRTGNNGTINYPNNNPPSSNNPLQSGQLNSNNLSNPLGSNSSSSTNPNLNSTGTNNGPNASSNNVNSSNSGGVGVKKGFSVPDRFGLLGILSVIRMTDPDLNTLASGVDLTTLGLNLNSPESLYPTFVSPFAEAPSRREPEFLLPHCYYVQPPLLPPRSKLTLLSDETIFYIFYSMPKDPLQADAAAELYNRDWRYHKEHQRWFRRVPGTESQLKTVAYERGSYIYFEYTTWEKIRKDNFLLVYEALEAKREPE